MDEFIHSASTLALLIGTVVFNQLISGIRTWLSKRKMSKSVETIKNQVTANGGSSLSDKVDKALKGIDTLALRQEDARALLEAYFAMLLNSETKALFRADENGHWTFCNEKASDILGMYARETLGRGWEIAIGKDQRERNEFMAAYQDFFSNGRPLNEMITIINQETKVAEVYKITAKQFTGNKLFLFNLGKISKTQ